MANEKTPVVWDGDTNKHRPLGAGEKMGGLDASSILSSDSGNLIQTGSDGLAYLSGSGIADPRADNLLEESDQGRLQVTADRFEEWLDGHPQDAAAIAGKLAAQLADGKTIVAADGRLTGDPTNATPAQKAAINSALADPDSGLVVDPSTGMLQVDFSAMPTDKFEDLLKSLRMLVPLTGDMDLYVSVNDSAAGDEIVDGRGTAAKPFRHIQAAVDFATSHYAVGNYRVAIRVVAGTYNENVTLPDFSRGTGYMEIVPDSGARDVVVVAQSDEFGTRGRCFRCIGGYWRLFYMDARRVENPTTDNSPVASCYYAGGGSTRLDLYGCAASQSMPSGSSPLGGNNYTVRIFEVNDGASMRLYHGTMAGSISAQKPSSGTPAVDVFSVERDGSLWLVMDHDSANSPATTPDIACSGSCDTFMHCWQGGSVNTYASGTLINFTGSMEGKRYALYSGSSVKCNGSATYFPGDTEGSVDSSTYCWYA